jgi:hypothetical protein
MSAVAPKEAVATTFILVLEQVAWTEQERSARNDNVV